MGILTILCAQGCCGWCSLGTCRAAAAPAAWHRLETRDYTSTSRESLEFFTLWVVLMIKLTSLKIKSAS